jgi:hypothetical protein
MNAVVVGDRPNVDLGSMHLANISLNDLLAPCFRLEVCPIRTTEGPNAWRMQM